MAIEHLGARGAAALNLEAGGRTLADLRPGQIIQARVDARLVDGSLRLSTATSSFEARLPGNHSPGTTVALRVVGSGNALSVVPAGTSTTPSAGQAGAASPPSLPQTLATVTREAVTTQNSLAPLIATAHTAQSAGAPLPPALNTMIGQLLGLRLDGGTGPTAESVQRATANSGLFYEAKLAQGVPRTMVAGDLKGVLLAMQGALRALAGGDAAVAQKSVTGKPAPPPRKGAVPHAPVQAPLPDLNGTSESELARLLFAETRSALSRLRLAQIASLPDSREGTAGGGDKPGATWTFELPMLMNGRMTGIQFLIERDAARAGDDEHGAQWRVRIAFDAGEPVGAVTAQVALLAGTLRVTLWAETEEGAAQLRQNQGDLSDSLQGEGLEVAELNIRAGLPRDDTGPTGAFLDEAT